MGASHSCLLECSFSIFFSTTKRLILYGLCLCVRQVLKRMSAMVGTRLTITYDKNSPQTVLADDQRLYQVRKHPLHCLIVSPHSIYHGPKPILPPHPALLRLCIA